MKTIRTKPRNGATQIRYVGDPILGYLLSSWTDGRFRLTSPTTGSIARTFGTLEEVADYRREMNKRHSQAPDFGNLNDQLAYS